MPDLIRYLPPRRAFAIFTLLWLNACETQPASPPAQLELIAGSDRAACASAPPGDLSLQGLDAPVRVQVSGAELCAGAPIQRELPPGLYTLSWRGSAQPAALDATEDSRLSGPSVVSLFAGQLTLLRVQVELEPPSLCSSSS